MAGRFEATFSKDFTDMTAFLDWKRDIEARLVARDIDWLDVQERVTAAKNGMRVSLTYSFFDRSSALRAKLHDDDL